MKEWKDWLDLFQGYGGERRPTNLMAIQSATQVDGARVRINRAVGVEADRHWKKWEKLFYVESESERAAKTALAKLEAWKKCAQKLWKTGFRTVRKETLYYNHFGLDGKPTNMPYAKPAPIQAPRKSTGIQFTPLNFGDKRFRRKDKEGQWAAITRGASKASWQKPVERTEASFTLPSLPAPESRVNVAPAPATISAAVVQTRRTKPQKKKETTHKDQGKRNATQEVAFLREIAQKHKARKQTVSKAKTRGLHNDGWTCKCGLANPNMRTHYVAGEERISDEKWAKLTEPEKTQKIAARARREKAASTERATECSKCGAARPVAAVQRRKPRRNSNEQSGTEERYDEEYEKYFKKHEFRSFYGGYAEWDAAKCTAKFTAKQAEGFFADEASAQTATQTTTWNEQTQIERRQTTYHAPAPQTWGDMGFDAYVPEPAPATEMPPAPKVYGSSNTPGRGLSPTAPYTTEAYTLPEGWSEHVSQKDGQTFYWHEATDTRQWEWPNELQTEKLNRWARQSTQQNATVSDAGTEWSNPDYDAKPTFSGLPEASTGLVRAVSTGSTAAQAS